MHSILRLAGETAAHCTFALPDLCDEGWYLPFASCDQTPVELIQPGDTLPDLEFKAARPIRRTYAILTRMGERPGPRMIDTAAALYDHTFTDGWTIKDVDDIVYTLDPTSNIVVPQRMHWVVYETASVACVLVEVADSSRAEDLVTDYARAIVWTDPCARAGMGRWTHKVAPGSSVSMLV